MDASTRHNRLVHLLEPVLAEAGLDLEELDITSDGNRRVLRLIVDADGGVDLDTIGEVSRTVSEALDNVDDNAEVMGSQPYVLEVTSPGAERPLTRRRHWQRSVGRLVQAKLTAGGQVKGRVVAADDSGVTLDHGDRTHVYSYEELGDGQVQVELRRGRGKGRNLNGTAAD